MKELNDELKKKICLDYQNKSIETIAKENKMSDRRVRKLLIENNIEIKNSHKKSVSNDDYMELNNNRFKNHEGFVYKAKSKIDQTVFDDYLNKSGSLTRHIKEKLNIEIPSLFLRKKYFHENAKQWHEQWFDIIEVEDEKIPIKKCPYCSWETKDVENKSGMFMTHLLKEHGITIEQYLLEHPEDKEYFSKQNCILLKKEKLHNDDNYVICPICGEKMEKITYWHIKSKHNMEFNEFKRAYPDTKIMSLTMIEQSHVAQKMCNLAVSKERFISKYEKELQDMLRANGIEFECNRQILEGREIDILVPSRKIGIEFDGLKWHTEWFGKKDRNYHLEKTIVCNRNGYGLIHVFEDEYVNSKDLVENKILHILGIEKNKEKVYARKCKIKEIYKNDAQNFLNQYHIQGFSSSTIYLGAFYNNMLIAVMSFKHNNIKNKGWELTRFATNSQYIYCGVGGKLFSYFCKIYNPESVYSFADRRWTVDINSNIYIKLGFEIESVNNPDYKYYNERVERYKRFHKMGFSKAKLHKKYGLPLTMTETEMAKELGYDRIWDCGLVKYRWVNKNL